MSNLAEKISITVTPAMKRTLEERVASGQFASASELIREALRVWQRREDEHEQKLAALTARVQMSIDDPRPALTVDDARRAFKDFVALQTS